MEQKLAKNKVIVFSEGGETKIFISFMNTKTILCRKAARNSCIPILKQLYFQDFFINVKEGNYFQDRIIEKP